MGRTRTWSKYIPGADGSAADASIAMHGEYLYVVVDVSNNSTVAYAGPCIVGGVYVNTVLSAHVCPIQDNTTPVFSLPASAAAGSIYTLPGIRFETNLTVDPNDAATGSITIAYRPI